MTLSLEPLLHHVPAWLMVLFRLTGIFIFAPVLGSNTIPRIVKVFLALSLSLCIYPMLLDPDRPSAAMVAPVIDGGLSLWTLIGAVGLELLIGLVIGYVASLPLIGMQIGGHVIDQQIGLAFAGVFNPELDEQSGVVGEVMFLLALAVFVILGGHRAMFSALVGSFDRVPLGGFTSFGSLIDLLIGLLAVMFDLAVRVAAPLLCLMFLVTLSMGFVARTVPQMNILSVGFSIRILLGTGFLTVMVGTVGWVYIDQLRAIIASMLSYFAPG